MTIEFETNVIGTIDSVPVLKEIGSNTVINFSLQVPTATDGEGSTKQKWVKCSIWNKPEMMECLQKGTLISIRGNAGAYAYTDKDGNMLAQLTLRVLRIHVLAQPASTDKTTNQYE